MIITYGPNGEHEVTTDTMHRHPFAPFDTMHSLVEQLEAIVEPTEEELLELIATIAAPVLGTLLAVNQYGTEWVLSGTEPFTITVLDETGDLLVSLGADHLRYPQQVRDMTHNYHSDPEGVHALYPQFERLNDRMKAMSERSELDLFMEVLRRFLDWLMRQLRLLPTE